eukprot:4961775-Pleurochrysis_carterae.AAC.1
MDFGEMGGVLLTEKGVAAKLAHSQVSAPRMVFLTLCAFHGYTPAASNHVPHRVARPSQFGNRARARAPAPARDSARVCAHREPISARQQRSSKGCKEATSSKVKTNSKKKSENDEAAKAAEAKLLAELDPDLPPVPDLKHT